MNTSTIIALTFAGGLALYFFNKSRSAGFLNFYLKNAELKFSGITPILTLGLAIQNPSNSSFTIKSVVGNLYSNSYLIGNVSAYGEKIVAPASEQIYPLEVRLSLIGVVSDLVKVFTGGGIAQQVEFDGAINVDNLTQPLDFKYTIG